MLGLQNNNDCLMFLNVKPKIQFQILNFFNFNHNYCRAFNVILLYNKPYQNTDLFTFTIYWKCDLSMNPQVCLLVGLPVGLMED